MTYLLACFLTASSAIDLGGINTASIEAKIIPYISYNSLMIQEWTQKGQAILGIHWLSCIVDSIK